MNIRVAQVADAAVVAPPLEAAEEMDLRDAEAEASDVSLEEVGEWFAAEEEGAAGQMEVQGEPDDQAVEVAVLDAVAEASAPALGEMETEVAVTAQAAPDDKGAASSSSAPVPEAEAPPPPPPAAEEPWRKLGGPSPAGYVYQGDRHVMRIQRGAPQGSCTITCYQHPPKCALLIADWRCPSDDVLKQWLLEVPRTAPAATQEERTAAGKRHMASGRRRWYAGGEADREWAAAAAQPAAAEATGPGAASASTAPGSA